MESVNIRKHLAILGKRVRDRVTGMKGVATSVGFDLYGCVQVIVNPAHIKDGKMADSRWFDIDRLEVQSDKPVMRQPDFDFGAAAEGRKGPAEKPPQMKP